MVLVDCSRSAAMPSSRQDGRVTQPVVDAISQILLADPVVPVPTLLAGLRTRGVELDEAELDLVLRDDELRRFSRIDVTDPVLLVDLRSLLTGRVFTHRLSADEVERDLLYTLPDFAALWPVLDLAPFDQLDGRPIGDDFDDDALQAVIRLAPGTLAGHATGSLVALTAGDAGLQLHSAAAPPQSQLTDLVSDVAEDYLAVFGADLAGAGVVPPDEEPDFEGDAPEDRGAVELDEFLCYLCLRHPQLFTTPGWPVADLLTRLDLDHDNGAVAISGFDFDSDEQPTEAERIQMLIEDYDLDVDQAKAVIAFSTAIDEVHDALLDREDSAGQLGDDLPAVEPHSLIPALRALADPMVAVAVAEENLAGDPDLAVALQSIMNALTVQVPRRAQAGRAWLLGRCADRLGDVPDAERNYGQALELDPDHFPAMRELATLASLHGDARKAVSLLGRAGVPIDDPELVLLSHFVGEARGDLGRNDPCWCGSGQKYKRCHLDRSDFDLAQRRDWLYDKAGQWGRDGAGRDLLIELAEIRAAGIDTHEGLAAAVDDPLVVDVALFEGGLLADFLDERGDQLPTDEQQLAGSWLHSRRALYTVAGVEDDRGCLVTDVATENATPFLITDPPLQVRPGELLCLRLLETAGTVHVSGGPQRVPAELRQVTTAVLAEADPDPADIMSVLTAAASRARRPAAAGRDTSAPAL